jgi:hypothetical protein
MLERLNHWLLGPEENFGDAINKNPVSTIAKSFVLLLLALISTCTLAIGGSWAVFFFGPKPGADIATTSQISTNAPCSVATSQQSGGSNSPCSNQVGSFQFQSSSTTPDLIAGENGDFNTDYLFTSTSPIVPNQACTEILSDVAAIFWGPGGIVTTTFATSTKRGSFYVYKECFYPVLTTEDIQITTAEPPHFTQVILIDKASLQNSK